MTDNDEIFQLLGFNMMLIDKQNLVRLDLPASTKDWLALVGIPEKTLLPYGLIFHGSDQLEPFVTKSQSGVVVGESEGPTYIVVRKDGVVILVDKLDNSETYMNTSIGQFIMSLCKFTELTQDKFLLNEFQYHLNEIDVNATKSEESFWSVAIEDMFNLQL